MVQLTAYQHYGSGVSPTEWLTEFIALNTVHLRISREATRAERPLSDPEQGSMSIDATCGAADSVEASTSPAYLGLGSKPISIGLMMKQEVNDNENHNRHTEQPA